MKVYGGAYKKKLAEGNTKHYEYGTVSIQSTELAEYVGKEVKVVIYIEDKKPVAKGAVK